MAFDGYQEVKVVGYVGKEPEVRETGGGKQVANFLIPTTTRYGDKENTEWHRCVAWGKLAGVVNSYVNKGTLILVNGRLQTRSWEQDGQKKYTTEIIVQHLVLLPGGGKRQSQSQGNSEPSGDVPF